MFLRIIFFIFFWVSVFVGRVKDGLIAFQKTIPQGERCFSKDHPTLVCHPTLAWISADRNEFSYPSPLPLFPLPPFPQFGERGGPGVETPNFPTLTRFSWWMGSICPMLRERRKIHSDRHISTLVLRSPMANLTLVLRSPMAM